MSACDYCSEGPINFCQMCGTSEGSLLHWEYIQLWNLHGMMPCDYQYPSFEWIEKSRVWVDQMNAATHQELEFRLS